MVAGSSNDPVPVETRLQRLMQADVDVVDRILAQSTLRQLPIQTTDLKAAPAAGTVRARPK